MINLRDIIEFLQQYFLDIIRERRNDSKDKLVKVLLFLFSRIYRRAVQFRIWLYDKRIFRPRALGCLVVSIGNITCGGTGKTPVVEKFAKTLTQKGRKVAVLSRGYRSKDRSIPEKIIAMFKSKKSEVPPRIVSDGKHLLLNSLSAGDEPYMLATNLKDVAVIVDKDRVKSGRYAISDFETDTLILDDGFQYLDLKPRLNILLIDSTDPFDNHHVLPRGLLREPIKNIRRANYIFLTKSDGSHKINHLKRFIRRHNKKAEIIECRHKPLYLEDVFNSDEKIELDYLKNSKIAALSGIANPESFENFLDEFGAEIIYRERFADHHRFEQQEIIDFINKAIKYGAKAVITTEKDAVRIPRLDRRDIPIFFLRVEIDIISGQESFDQCISRICFS
ncbi:MAG TPA: tetraacyldisaccharide 4'-kinase [Victivallales bacterium]|nr:tetraacyldisaccharide 4'-kinase [Victivallales bacterium]HRR05943.1 tetraacyldisaccharide 4'-kinase [Victivallales bacterium]HRR28536.1 tetraacyldisaccharide 4'-kinase [Victivallales bacterium]HRU02100.1 tetraacyldisaccharide 4'-kinase [Victivallales bacterium]